LLLTSSMIASAAPGGNLDLSIKVPQADMQALRAHFLEKGWVRIPRASSTSLVNSLPSFVKDDIASDPDALQHYEINSKGDKVLTRTEFFAHKHAGLKKILHEDIPDVLSQLGPLDRYKLYKEKVNYKLPNTAGYAAHQDAAAYPEATSHVTCLVAVDASTKENGCLWFQRGYKPAATPKLSPDTTEDGIIDPKKCANYEWDACELEPGDIALFDSYIPHKSSPNKSPDSRRLLYLTYNDATLGDLRSAYYKQKMERLQSDGNRISHIKHWQGEVADVQNPIARVSGGSATMSPEDAVKELREIYTGAVGQTQYEKAVITQLEHALQSAQQAELNGGSEEQIVAALVHDIGHLLQNDHADGKVFLATDHAHETVGAEYLRSLGFPEAIFKAVEMHVSGKRFLTSEYRGDDGEKYYEHLTPVSKASLKLQGGPFTKDEAEEFLTQTGAKLSIDLRIWDDNSKVKDCKTKKWEDYQEMVLKVLKRGKDKE